MADTTVQEQIVKESPALEAAKLKLLEEAGKVTNADAAGPALSPYEIAGLAPQQVDAIKMAGQGVGSYAPYMKSAGQAYTKAAEGYGGLPQYGIAGMDIARNAAQQGVNVAGAYGQQGVNVAGDAANRANAGVGGYSQLATALGMAGAQAYDPNSVNAYMNPYQEQVTKNAVAEMTRQAQLQQQQLSAQGAKAGAFGGSRQGVQAAETNRNLSDISSKRIFEDYFQNYSQAQQAAMSAFQNQQTRAQTAGNIALGAGQNIGNTAIQGGNLGLSAASKAGDLGLSAAMQGGQLGVNAANNAGNLQGASAAGLATLGTSTANLGQMQSGLQQGDTAFLYNIGQKQQDQRQREIDAARKTEVEAKYEPFQRVSFLSDIYKGAPSSQQTISQTTAPSASLVSQVAGLGTAGLAAYNLTK